MHMIQSSVALRPLILAIALVTGCVPDKTDDTATSTTTTQTSTTQTSSTNTTTTASTTTTTTATTTTTSQPGTPTILTCPIPSPCGLVDFSGAWSGSDFAPEVRCIFESLRTASTVGPGSVDFGTNLSGDSPARTHVQLDGASQQVLRQNEGYLNGSGAWIDPVQTCTLASAAYFQDCLDTPDLDCSDSTNWLTGCVNTPAPVCPT